MKKIYIFLLIILALIAYLRFVIGGDEDTWICVDGAWVKHGNPANPPPTIGCGELASPSSESSSSAGLANPAAVYCIEQGGKLRMEENDLGQHGICILSDNTECEEWAYFRGECP